jgi:hypothetical protein
MGAAAILLAAGTAMSVYGQQKAASDRAKALETSAYLGELQARQTEIAGAREYGIIERQGRAFEGGQVAAVGQSGTTLSGSNLLALEKTAADVNSELAAKRAETDYRAQVSRTQAGSLIDQAGQAKTAANIESAGTILGNAYNGYSAYHGNTPRSGGNV